MTSMPKNSLKWQKWTIIFRIQFMGKWFKLLKKDSICKLKRDTAILNILQIFQINFKDVINWCFGSDYTIY